jgi:hypothetical protein
MSPTRKSRTSMSGRHLSLVPSRRRCGLCGKRDRLTQTECGQQWVCDDAHTYELFSYTRNSCDHNHGRFTLCGFHYNERHHGEWKTCEPCRRAFATELYVYFGTNEYNFERLENPPAVEPTRCRVCQKRIRLGEDSFGGRAGHDVCRSGGEAERSKR